MLTLSPGVSRLGGSQALIGSTGEGVNQCLKSCMAFYRLILARVEMQVCEQSSQQ